MSPFLSEFFITRNKRNFVNNSFSYCCSLFFTFSVCRQPGTTSVTRIPSDKFKTLVVLSIGSGSGSSASFRSLCFPNFYRKFLDVLQLMGVKQLEEISSLHMLEVSFILPIGSFGDKRHSMKCNKRGINFGVIVFIVFP